jgi:hypothetical protein
MEIVRKISLMLVCSFFALVFHPLFLSFGFDFYTETPFIVLHIVLTYIIVGTLIWMWAGKRVWWKQGLSTLVKRNWLLGLRIQHEVLKDKRAEYGNASEFRCSGINISGPEA